MQARDERALASLLRPMVSGRATRLVTRMLKAADDVEDVVEETFWQVWRQADRFARSVDPCKAGC